MTTAPTTSSALSLVLFVLLLLHPCSARGAAPSSSTEQASLRHILQQALLRSSSPSASAPLELLRRWRIASAKAEAAREPSYGDYARADSAVSGLGAGLTFSPSAGVRAVLSEAGLRYAKDVVVTSVLQELVPLAIPDLNLFLPTPIGQVAVNLTQIALWNATVPESALLLDPDTGSVTVYAGSVDANLSSAWSFDLGFYLRDKGNATVTVGGLHAVAVGNMSEVDGGLVVAVEEVDCVIDKLHISLHSPYSWIYSWLEARLPNHLRSAVEAQIQWSIQMFVDELNNFLQSLPRMIPVDCASALNVSVPSSPLVQAAGVVLECSGLFVAQPGNCTRHGPGLAGMHRAEKAGEDEGSARLAQDKQWGEDYSVGDMQTGEDEEDWEREIVESTVGEDAGSPGLKGGTGGSGGKSLQGQEGGSGNAGERGLSSGDGGARGGPSLVDALSILLWASSGVSARENILAAPGDAGAVTSGGRRKESGCEEGRMITLGVAQEVVDSAVEVYYQSGEFTFALRQLPSSFPFQLNTHAWRFILPSLYRQYPNRDMELAFQAEQKPNMTLSEVHGLGAAVDAAFYLRVLLDEGPKDVMVISISMRFSAAAAIRENNLTASAALSSLSVDLRWSTVGNIPQSLLEGITQALAKVVLVPLLNWRLASGFPLPSIPGVAFSNASIVYHRASLEICSDLEYTGGIFSQGLPRPAT